MKSINPTILATILTTAVLAAKADNAAQTPESHSTRITTDFIDANVSRDYPGFEGLSVDSLGKVHFPLVIAAPPASHRPTRAVTHGWNVEYYRPGAADTTQPRWAIGISKNEVLLESHWSSDDPPEPLELNLENQACHATLLGVMETNGSIRLPALMHFPDQGTFQISSEGASALGYTAAYDGKVVQIIFPGASREKPVIKYHWRVTEIHPPLSNIDSDGRFDGFRRDWLNIFQFSPHWRMLANHVTSDTCAFCYYEYADIASRTPALADGVTADSMIRQTFDQIIGGANAYGMPGHGAFPEFATDTLPSLLIAANDYVRTSEDNAWLNQNYDHLKSWAEQMLATDKTGDGLIKYMLSGNSGSWPEQLVHRPANWWDTIGFGHEDAYANALAFRALRGLAELARKSNHPDDALRFDAAAEKIKEAYFKTFYNPETGILAGWRSADGQLHDYYFLWVNGIAIHYGLIPTDKANDIMDHLLAKMKEVGYNRFDLGLPGNLIPVARKDYVDHNPRFGGGHKEDNTDGFQIYENGGATACFAYFTVAALYDLGRIEDGDKIFMPMLDSFAKGDFQGRDESGRSKDWRTWDGKCWGYEGMLTDNYYALLAVLDRDKALKKRATSSNGK